MATSRKIYIAVLVLALAVLIWDKGLNPDSVSTPQSIQAQPQPAVPSDEPDGYSNNNPIVSAEPILPVKNPGETIRHLIQSRTDENISANTRNLFVVSEKMLLTMGNSQPETEKQAQLAQQISTLELSTIMIIGKTRCAMINHEVLYPGQYIGPYRLAQVKSDAVILEYNSERITLDFDR